MLDVPRRRRPTGLTAGLAGVAALLAVALALGLRERPDSSAPPQPPGEDREPGGGRLPPIPIDPRWRSLLDAEPVMVAWEHVSGREKPLFDAELHSYRVRSDYAEWIATTGDMNGLGFEMRAGVQLENWVGMAALVWGYQDEREVFPEKRKKCLTVEFSRWNTDRPAMLRIRRHSLELVAFDDQRINRSATIAETEVHLPAKTTAPLVIQVRKSGVVVQFDDGAEWRPEDILNETDWHPQRNAKIGIMGSGREVGFTDLEIRDIK